MTRPNILFICTDQHRFDLLGAAGNPHVKTPHLDRLAGEGVLFEQCYTPNPVCAPTRASILTGRYPRAHGLWGNGVPLPGHARLFTRALADAGYDCGLVGKLHLGACFGQRTEPRYEDGLRVYRWAHAPSHRSPQNAYHHWLQAHHPALYERAAEAVAGRRPGTSGTTVERPQLRRHAGGGALHPLGGRGGDRVPAGDTRPGRGAPAGRGNKNPSSFGPTSSTRTIPSSPRGSTSTATTRRRCPCPLGSERDLDDRPPILAEASRRSYGGHARGYAEHSPEELREIVRAYYAMVSFVDDEVGRILSALDELGLRESTLIVFSSDHGEMLGDHGLLLKGPMMYEGAVRVPLLMRWPGVLPEGARRAELVSLVDLCATFLAAAGLPDLPASQGDSLLPLARGEPGGAATPSASIATAATPTTPRCT